MSNLWIDLNENIPNYFNDLAEKYSLKFVRISNLKTALMSNKYALILSVDRFSVGVEYAFRNGKGELKIFSCGNYFAERYDNDDRRNLLKGNGIKETIINNFIIINNGLISKWEQVLLGNSDWLKDFQKSKWYNEKKYIQMEQSILEKFL